MRHTYSKKVLGAALLACGDLQVLSPMGEYYGELHAEADPFEQE